MATINNTNSEQFIPEIWSQDVLSFVNKNLVMANLVTNRSVDAKFGDTVRIPIAGAFSAQDKVANTEVTIQNPTNSQVSILLNKHKEVSFLVEDITAIQSNTDLMSIYTSNAGQAIAQAVDSDLLGLYAGLSQSVGTYATDIDEDTVLAAKLKLDDADAPKMDRSIVVTPAQENAMLKIDRFTRNDAFGPNVAIKEGQIGRIHGFDVYSTTGVVKTGVGSTDTNNIAFQKSAFALAIQLAPRTLAFFDQKNLGWLVTVDTIYGVAEVKDSYAVLVKS